MKNYAADLNGVSTERPGVYMKHYIWYQAWLHAVLESEVILHFQGAFSARTYFRWSVYWGKLVYRQVCRVVGWSYRVLTIIQYVVELLPIDHLPYDLYAVQYYSGIWACVQDCGCVWKSRSHGHRHSKGQNHTRFESFNTLWMWPMHVISCMCIAWEQSYNQR